MSNTRKWKGGNKASKPEVEDDLLNPENPNYLLTDAELQKQKEGVANMNSDKKEREGDEDWEAFKAGKIGRS